jgi:hypothetical protein
MSARRRAVFAVTVLSGAFLPRTASADLNLPYMGPSSGWYLPVGVDLAYAWLPAGTTGALLGGEASVAYVDFSSTPHWYGAFVSGGYLTNTTAGRFSVGPEVGYAIFGLDGGFVDVVSSGKDYAGFTLRPMLTVGFLTLYGRWDHLVSGGGTDMKQAGVLLKFPVALTGKL